MTTIKTGTLCDSATNATIRQATEAETLASLTAARTDGGGGHITVDGRRCYVEGGELVEVDGVRLGMHVAAGEGDDADEGDVLELRPATSGSLAAEARVGWSGGHTTWIEVSRLSAS